MLTLYGTSKTRAFRCLWLLEECHAEFKHVPLNPKKGEHYQEPYKSLIQSRKVPYLEDGEIKLFESAAICIYLARRFEQADLWPQQPKLEAYAMQWLSYLLQEVDPQLYLATLHSKLLPPEQQVSAIVVTAIDALKRPLKILTQHLSQKQDAGLGMTMLDEFSLVDIFASQCFSWLQWIAPELSNETLQSYNREMSSRPAYQRAQKYP